MLPLSFPPWAALLTSVAVLVKAQDVDMRVHGAVVFTRAGERIPNLIDAGVRELTSLGAQQLHAAGDFFRNRYLKVTGGEPNDTLAINHILDIDTDRINNDQILIMTPEGQHTQASAQAFIQALFPPHQPPFTSNSTTSPVYSALAGDAESVLANGSYLNYPLGGYQYAQIRTYSSLDPHSIYLDGSMGCDNHALSMFDYYNTDEYKEIRNQTRGLYSRVSGATINDARLSSAQQDYGNAYNIYEYLDYQYNHDNETYATLSAEDTSFTGDLQRIRALAAQQQWAFYGDSSVDNNIRTMPGRTLAAQVLGLLQQNIETRGDNYKLNLLFGDHEPFMSFSSIASIAERNPMFYGLPEHASSMVFELYSMGATNDTNDNLNLFPARDELWVNFYFRNGTSDDGYDLRNYPIFHRGPSTSEMRWNDFEDYMQGIMTSSPGDWCKACSSSTGIFCDFYARFDETTPNAAAAAATRGLSPAVAGVIGAMVTLAVLALLGIAAFAFGVRTTRTSRLQREIGGYKGSAKMASDADLVLPKTAVIAGATNGGRERVGSWELRQKELRREEEEDEIAVSPHGKPVESHTSF